MKIKKVVPKQDEPTVDENGEGGGPEEDELILPSAIAPPPDQMVAAGTETLTWMNRNRGLVAAGLGALALLVIFISVRLQTSNERRADQAEPVLEAIGTAMAPADAQDGAVAARERALLQALEPLTGHARLGEGSTLMQARAHLALGDAAQARSTYTTLIEGARGTGVSLVARVGAAEAAAAAGDMDTALAMLDALAADLGDAWALRRKAELLDVFGEPERALEAWRRAADVAEGEETSAIQNRIARLEIDLQVEPSPEAAPEAD